MANSSSLRVDPGDAEAMFPIDCTDRSMPVFGVWAERAVVGRVADLEGVLGPREDGFIGESHDH
jgi:hypothetical protein